MTLTVSGSLSKRGWKKGKRMRFVLPLRISSTQTGAGSTTIMQKM